MQLTKFAAARTASAHPGDVEAVERRQNGNHGSLARRHVVAQRLRL
jgi:hypothetical protein